MFFSHQRSIVGVDIGTSCIKIAQISHGQQPVLDTYGIVALNQQIANLTSDTAVAKTAAILKTLLQQARVTAKKCVASLPNSVVFTSVIDMPKMSDQELDAAMKFEAKKYVPLPFADVVLSWSVVSSSASTGSNKVLLIAVPKQVQANYIRLFQAAELELDIIEIEALALIRSLITAKTPSNVIIIDIGAKSTGLNIVRAGVLQLTRNLNIGGDTMTDRIAQTLNISIARAEQFKRDFGVTQSAFIPEAVKPVLASIKNEAKQLIAIYQSHNVKLDTIILVGGGAHLPGITEFFADLGIPVELGKTLQTVAYTQAAAPLLDRFHLQLPIAIGLAMRQEA
jgi:type IV pilus assembly protein PilM